MQAVHIASLIGFSFLLSLGQILLKFGVGAAQQQTHTTTAMIYALLWTWQFWTAVALCGSLVLLWAWLLSIIPLSKAYPFIVLAFVFAAILEHYFFGQSLSWKFFAGCALIVSGLIVILY
jgi:drug/metabolite transporter (DMT)-like permease